MTNTPNKIFIYLLLLILSLSVGELNATRVNGEVSGEWTIQGHPYDVMSDIVLRAGQELTIEAGVLIRFNSGTQFDVFGTLLANGTADDSITFRANNGRVGDWSWLKFEGNGANQSVLAHCIIQHTDRGVRMLNSSPTIVNSRISHHSSTCFRLEGSRGTVRNCIITNSGGVGVIIKENSSPTFRNCTISQHPDHGMAFRDNSGGVITGNSIFDVSDHGLSLSEAGSCSLAYNMISRCGQRAISVFQSNLTRAFRNIIFQNRGDYAVYLYRSESIDFINNTLTSNSGTGLAIINSSVNLVNNVVITNGQDGIFVQDANPNQSSNCVWNNGRDDYAGIDPANSDLNESPQLNQEYIPAEGSPVIDRGDNRYRDPDDTRSDIGARFFNQNHPPEIQRFWPENVNEIQGDTEQEFGVEASDPENHDITYIWLVNRVSSGDESVFNHIFTVDGNYDVSVILDDSFYEGRTVMNWSFSVIGSGVSLESDGIAESYRLSSPYPNPFNGISQFSLYAHALGVAEISLVDLNGRTIKTFHKGIIQKGQHLFSINSDDFPAGTFIIRATINGRREHRKLVILK